MMKYRGYQARITYDDEASVFHGEVVGTRDVIFFEGTSIDSLRAEMQFSIDDYLAMCAERGQEPDKPFSGRIPLRIPSDLHRDAALAAETEGKSLNAWIAEVIRQSANAVRSDVD